MESARYGEDVWLWEQCIIHLYLPSYGKSVVDVAHFWVNHVDRTLTHVNLLCIKLYHFFLLFLARLYCPWILKFTWFFYKLVYRVVMIWLFVMVSFFLIALASNWVDITFIYLFTQFVLKKMNSEHLFWLGILYWKLKFCMTSVRMSGKCWFWIFNIIIYLRFKFKIII